jgi:hypothetical protein
MRSLRADPTPVPTPRGEGGPEAGEGSRRVAASAGLASLRRRRGPHVQPGGGIPQTPSGARVVSPGAV